METTPHVRSGSRYRRQQGRSMRTHNDLDNMHEVAPETGGVPKQKQKKPLNFHQAMSDFQTMFPHIDRGVIETVLRANDGVVQSTIDQLLVLSETTEEEKITEGPRLPEYHECRRSEFVDEPPPAYSECENDGQANLISQYSIPQVSNTDIQYNGNFMHPCREERLRFWNPPMIGTLPVDFLRLDSDSPVQSQPQTGSAQSSNAEGFLTDSELEQYLEDQKLAMFLQNEEFIRHLRRDPDFITSLEEDHREFMQSQLNIADATMPPSRGSAKNLGVKGSPSNPGGARPRSSPTIPDDAAFRNKLKHMGHSTRKKLGKMARRFSRKKNLKLGSQGPSHGASTANLLEDSDDEESKETGLEGIQEHEDYQDDRTDTIEDDPNNTNKEKTGRQLPTVPTQNKKGNQEPIVFYSEDNEFDFYD